MRTWKLVAAVFAVIAFGAAATVVPAKKHAHGVNMFYVETQIVTPPGGVNGGIAFCPSGTVSTGTGVDYVSGLGEIADMDIGSSRTSSSALIDNFDSTLTSVMNVQAACVGSTTRVRARPVPRAQVRQQLAEAVAELRAAHEESAAETTRR